MANGGEPGGSLFAELVALGRSVADLVRTVRKHTGGQRETPLTHPEPARPAVLPAPEPHFESAQLLTQRTPSWHRPNPPRLAAPTYAPAMTAFGIVFMALGTVTRWPLSVVGVLIFFLALAKWIGELLHD